MLIQNHLVDNVDILIQNHLVGNVDMLIQNHLVDNVDLIWLLTFCFTVVVYILS